MAEKSSEFAAELAPEALLPPLGRGVSQAKPHPVEKLIQVGPLRVGIRSSSAAAAAAALARGSRPALAFQSLAAAHLALHVVEEAVEAVTELGTERSIAVVKVVVDNAEAVEDPGGEGAAAGFSALPNSGALVRVGSDTWAAG